MRSLMVDKISINSIKKSGKNTFSIDIDLPEENTVEEVLESDSVQEIPVEELVEEKTETLEQEELEPFTLNITPTDDTEDTYKPHRKVITLSEMTNDTKGVIENSLARGTDNIYIIEKKYILPIEHLDDATYTDNLKGG